MVNPIRRPERLQRPQQNNQNTPENRPQRPVGVGQSPRNPVVGNGRNNNQPPSPWLNPDNEPKPDQTASFVEYLRWMRPADHDQKDATKVQILQMATDNANYRQRLETLTKRTELIAGKNNIFQVKCSWRIRVGGHRGPENILLPAFDAQGIPYIPASTLRGVARNQVIREILAKNHEWRNLGDRHDKKIKKRAEELWKEADKQVSPYFGSLEAEKKDQAGKIVFLDAYPMPSKTAGLEMDMANNIWNWDGNNLQYSPNPNPFLSLKETIFLIGIRLTSHCNAPELLEQAKKWLIEGLAQGLGSQVNTGYGQLIKAGVKPSSQEFFRVEFALEGQLIHGYQKFTQWQQNNRGNWQMRGQAQAEVRPTAFKSMLRYWFRAFGLGVMTPEQVKTWEAKIFGGIQPNFHEYGYLKVNVLDGKVSKKEPRPNYQGKNDPCGEQQGTLVLSLSSETPHNQQEKIKLLCQYLTWLMFNLGGIGQGARRPCYSRNTRDRAPWWRGSTFYIDSEDSFWTAPSSPQKFAILFQKNLKSFYQALSQVTGIQTNYNQPREAARVDQSNWIEAVDKNCQILICQGQEKKSKPYALSLLHSPDFKIRGEYNGDLCGKVIGGVKASPVWIADLGDYQVVTIFGATSSPRKDYIKSLKNATSVFPLTSL